MLKQPIEKSWLYIFYSFGAFFLTCTFLAIYSENYLLAAVPPIFLFLYLSINDFKFIYFLMLATIPLSVEVALPGGFATDLPSEPLTVGLMVLFICFVLSKRRSFDGEFIRNSIISMVFIHYAWIVISTVYSADTYVSVKFTLAKTWYIITFLFLTAIIIRDAKDFKTAFWCLLIPLLFTVVFTLVRHARYNFSFESVNVQMYPFFRNHVNYACTLAQMIPFVILAISWYREKKGTKRFLLFALALMLVGIYFSYTRSSWLSLVTAGLMFFVIRRKFVNWVLAIGLAAVLGFFIYLAVQDHYLRYEPDYEHTVYHPELGDHLASTFEGEDVSSAERIYRWVAGVRMWADKPFTGYGPGNFYNFYKSYTVNSFQTYVSDNPEKSSIHNYFLLVLSEQGIFGLLIFVALTIVIMSRGQKIYHETMNQDEKKYVMAILLCLVIIYVNTFLSDLLETDKIGSFFFICIALLVNQDIRNGKLARSGTLPEVRS